jgi:hypothetical protein
MHPVRLLAALCLSLLVMDTGAAQADVLITVNKATQRMSVSIDGRPLYSWKVSTGRSGYETPSGSFTPFRLEEDHASKEFDGAPMPHSVFFTSRGHAIHGSNATRRLGSPASHGCIRLAPSKAKTLFSLVRRKGLRNTRIVVKNSEHGYVAWKEKRSRTAKRREPPKADHALPRTREPYLAKPAYGYAEPLDTATIYSWR